MYPVLELLKWTTTWFSSIINLFIELEHGKSIIVYDIEVSVVVVIPIFSLDEKHEEIKIIINM